MGDTGEMHEDMGDTSNMIFDAQSTNFDEEIGKIVGLLRLKPGMAYCEMGGGDGQFMTALSKNVMPGGKVMVTEAGKASLSAIEAKAQKAGIEIQGTLATETRMGLPADSCDVIFSRMVYHMIDETMAVKTYLPQLRQALKHGGRMLIIDHDPDTGATTRANATLTMSMNGMHHEMPVVPKPQEIVEFTSAGFALTKTLEWPWIPFNGHGYALTWEHPMPSSEDSTKSAKMAVKTINLETSQELQTIHLRQEPMKQPQSFSQSVDSTGRISRAPPKRDRSLSS